MISVCQDFSTFGSVFAAKTYYISILVVLTKCKVNNGNRLQNVIDTVPSPSIRQTIDSLMRCVWGRGEEWGGCKGRKRCCGKSGDWRGMKRLNV